MTSFAPRFSRWNFSAPAWKRRWREIDIQQFVRRSLLSGTLFFGLASALAQNQVSREYDLKAVLLYHFTQFVEWPAASFPRPDSPMVIGVLGRDPFGHALDILATQPAENGRRIVIVRLRNLDAARNCHILFVSESEQDRLPEIIAALRNLPVLTVGDFEGFATGGGIVRFMKTPDDRIRLRINLDSVRASGLNMSAKLLRIAEVISSSKP
jgi:YfiR/HmsC-like